MSDLPLHPGIVHIPVGLALILPLLALALGWAIHLRRALPRSAWAVVVGVLALAFGGALLALNTGEDEEERVEVVVPESAIHEHEERAEAFTWATGITLALALAALAVNKQPVGGALMIGTIAGTFVMAGLAFAVGHAGGSIVHRHMVQPAIQMPAGTGTSAAASKGPAGGADHDD